MSVECLRDFLAKPAKFTSDHYNKFASSMEYTQKRTQITGLLRFVSHKTPISVNLSNISELIFSYAIQ